MRAREPSLFTRLALRITLVLALGAVLLVSAAWYYARIAANDAYDRLLLGAALQIADNVTVENGRLSVSLPTAAFQLLGLSSSDRIFYRISAPSGATVTGYDDLGVDINLAKITTEPRLESGFYKGVAVRLAIVPRFLVDPAMSGVAHVLVAQTTDARGSLAGELTLKAILLVAIMSVLALAGAMLAIRYALQPLRTLGTTLRQRDPHNLTAVTVRVPREMRPFVSSINHFMHRLNERLSLLQRFTADAAHQIRTPLAALSAQLELMNTDQMDNASRQHLARVQERARELARLTNQLLSHAMVIHRADSVQLQPANLCDIARRAFRAAIPITIDPDIVVSFEAPDEAPMVRADGVSLREAIANVIDNALRHGARARLDVRVWTDDSFAYVEVADDGPGISREDWPRVTRRFETSQSGEGRAGLGFSIAAEVASAHGGRLSFRERMEHVQVFAVIIALPRLASPKKILGARR